MKRTLIFCILLAATAAGAEELTVSSIMSAYRAGAPTEGILSMVNNPANTINMATGDLATLRAAGVSEQVISALQARIPIPAPAPAPMQPDDARLVDMVRLIKAGISESIIAEQIRQSGQAYNLSVNDLLYLKENGIQESIIKELMTAHGTAPAPSEPRLAAPPAPVVGMQTPATPTQIIFDDLVQQRSTFMRRNRPGRLMLEGDTLSWSDGNDPKNNFAFQIGGLEKIWLTYQSRTPENFCYEINFQIIKGARYRFQDLARESGSNAAVMKVVDTLRQLHPTLPFGTPDVKN